MMLKHHLLGERHRCIFQIPHHGLVASTSNAAESWFDKVEMIKRRFRFFDKMSLSIDNTQAVQITLQWSLHWLFLFSFFIFGSLAIHQDHTLNKKPV